MSLQPTQKICRNVLRAGPRGTEAEEGGKLFPGDLGGDTGSQCDKGMLEAIECATLHSRIFAVKS